MGEATDITLPPDFARKSREQFDTLREEGVLFYHELEIETVQCPSGFKIEFQTSPSLKRKPILAANAPERRGVGGPFINPDPKFVVAQLGEGHVLEFSMHCIYRPHYVPHTREFRPQTEDLNLEDWTAAEAVVRAEEKDGEKMAVIYNCGYHAGASQGHKHLQVFEIAPAIAWVREHVRAGDNITSDLPGIPVQHYVLPLLPKASPEDVLQVYQRLLAEVRRFQEERQGGEAYNVVKTRDWICLIPRRYGGKDGVGTNGIGMLGVVWVSGREERDKWTEFGMEQHLVYMGYSRLKS